MAYDIIKSDMKKFRKRKNGEKLLEFLDTMIWDHICLSILVQIIIFLLYTGIDLLVMQSFSPNFKMICIGCGGNLVLLALSKIHNYVSKNQLIVTSPFIISIIMNTLVLISMIISWILYF